MKYDERDLAERRRDSRERWEEWLAKMNRTPWWHRDTWFDKNQPIMPQLVLYLIGGLAAILILLFLSSPTSRII